MVDSGKGQRRRPKIAILGGGMAGMAAAWRLSEPGWRDRFASITVYQRGWRLGGKGASSRGVHGRIEEHGLHVWLGYYENAFRLLRECYAELDRATSDPESPIRSWRDALIPAPVVGLEDRDDRHDTWHHWVGDFTTNGELPGEPHAPGGAMTVVELAQRALQLLAAFGTSLLPSGAGHRGADEWLGLATPWLPSGATPGSDPAGQVNLDAPSTPSGATPTSDPAGQVNLDAPSTPTEATPANGPSGRVSLGQLRVPSGAAPASGPAGQGKLGTSPVPPRSDNGGSVSAASLGLRRTWELVAVLTAVVRGIVDDGLLTDPEGFRRIDDEDFRGWIRRHGAPREAADSTFVSGMYDLAFAHEDGDPGRSSFGAGWGVFLTGKLLFDYKGSIFWKMTAGMGDVVFAPLYQALRRRGVEFAFFHRVDQLHLSPDRSAIDAISVGVQAQLADGVERYEPLVRVRGLPCFPARPLADQLAGADGIEDQPLESHWCTWPDAERRTLRRGEDFDVAVLAIPVGMAPFVCGELIADRPEWRDMVTHVGTVATQAFQIWLRDDEPSLGWARPGVTMTGYAKPFDTWSSMPQLVDAEDWPDDDRPATVAYFCGTLATPWPPDATAASAGAGAYAEIQRARVGAAARRFVAEHLGHLLPGATRDGAFRWELLCGRDGDQGPEAFDTQFWTANVDPSDRYVQSRAGTDRYRLRPDESGYDNLYLAGDWTDCGLNAGCIEAAVLSGLQAANAVLGRSRRHRIAGLYLL